jgi:two-component system, sensor histidine kinase and response regulator
LKHAGRAKPVFLLVDNRPDDVALEALLRRDDLDTVIARTGGEALELLSTRDVDLAIVALRGLGESGIMLADRMRGAERSRQVPIIVITDAARDATAMLEGDDSGAVDVLHEPIDPRILRNKVRTFVRLCEQRLELSEALRYHETFMAMLGHDLKNPLNAIVVASQLLAGNAAQPDGAEIADLAARIRRSAERMTAMIEQLHDPSRSSPRASCGPRASGRRQGWRARRELTGREGGGARRGRPSRRPRAHGARKRDQ